MATITVQAADTSTAMEEIALKLGDDAMILSTTKKNGKVIMQASTDVAARLNQAAEAAPTSSDFDRLFASRLGQELATGTHVDLSSVQRKPHQPHQLQNLLDLLHLSLLLPQQHRQVFQHKHNLIFFQQSL